MPIAFIRRLHSTTRKSSSSRVSTRECIVSRRIGYRHFHQHALGSESLGSVRSDSVAMIEVPRSVGAGPEISALRQHFDVVIFFCSLFHHSGFPKSRDEIGSCCDMGSVSRVSVRRAHFLFSLEKTDFIRGPVNGAGSRSKLTQKFLHCPHGPTSMRFRLPILRAKHAKGAGSGCIQRTPSKMKTDCSEIRANARPASISTAAFANRRVFTPTSSTHAGCAEASTASIGRTASILPPKTQEDSVR